VAEWRRWARVPFRKQKMIDLKGKPVPRAHVTLKLLTQREESLVHLVSQGLTNRDISKQLNLSEHTVRNYLIRIFNKLGTSNRVELALYGIHRSKEPSMSSSDIPSDRM
jgi:DNA-binding NarL/FixJ family response regulator